MSGLTETQTTASHAPAELQRCTQAGWKGRNFRRCVKPATTWFRATWPEPEEYIDYRCDLHASWLKGMQHLHESGPIGTEPVDGT